MCFKQDWSCKCGENCHTFSPCWSQARADWSDNSIWGTKSLPCPVHAVQRISSCQSLPGKNKNTSFKYITFLLEHFWFSIECCGTKTKVITVAYHGNHRQSNEPVKTQSKYSSQHQARQNACSQAAVKIWFYFWLVEKVAQDFFSKPQSVAM